jgi:hypothetical protein
MAIITGVGGIEMNKARMEPDQLGDMLKLTRTKAKTGGSVGFQRFD